MSQIELESLSQAMGRVVPKARLVLIVGLCLGGASIFAANRSLGLWLQVTGGALILAALAAMVVNWGAAQRRRLLIGAASALLEGDAAAGFVTDKRGDILFRNRAAIEGFRDPVADSLGFALTDIFANPGAVVFRLQARAQMTGHASEHILTQQDSLRLSVQRTGSEIFIWRLENSGGRGGGDRGPEVLGLPMLMAEASGAILYMNQALYRLLGGRVNALDEVFRDLPLVSGQVHAVDAPDGPVDCLVAEIVGQDDRREIYLFPAGESGHRTTRLGWDAVEDLPVPLLKVAADGKVLGVNRQARALLRAEAPVGRRLSDLMDGLGRPVTDWIAEVAAGRGTPEPQFLRVGGRHGNRFVQVTLNPAGAGANRHLIAVLNDVTEFKSLEAQFIQSQKMQAIGQLAGGVAHDFNNLLTAISGHCDLLLLRHGPGDPDYSDLNQIHQNANRAAGLVRQLLAFSRKQNLELKSLDLRDTLADLTHLLDRLVSETITLTLTHDPDLRMIRADKRQLEQVLMNLVVNARDAMLEGGEIRILTENVTLETPMERDRARVAPGNYVAVRISDCGTGIPPEVLPKIFEPFYTTKRTGEGTGLGLSTAYGIVKQTGGFIFVDSAPGEGTVFTLYFPSHDAPEKEEKTDEEQPGQPPAPAQPGEGVVLLVEDEAPVRAFAGRALRLRGYTVIEAESAEAALAILEDPDLAVDLFVTDVIMTGKDGPTWVREALQMRPDTGVVFVSGYAEDAFAEAQAAIPNSVFLAKPFSLADLTATVQRQLSRPEQDTSGG